MELKISEPHLSFVVSRLGHTNPNLLAQLRGRLTASAFSIDADNGTKLRDWLEEQLRLMDCGGKRGPTEAKKMLHDISTYTRWAKIIVRGKNIMKFKLSKIYIELLKSRLQNSDSCLFKMLQNGTIASYFKLDLNDDIAIELHNWAGAQIRFVGFDKDYNLTKYGQMLEDIMDLLTGS